MFGVSDTINPGLRVLVFQTPLLVQETPSWLRRKGSYISNENATKEIWQKFKVIGHKDYNSSFMKKNFLKGKA